MEIDNSVILEAPHRKRAVERAAQALKMLDISVVELGLVVTGFLGLWAGLAMVAGGPLYSDELWYIHTGLNNIASTRVLNRYTHIYLQKLFMELAPTPIWGVKIYWGFLIASTATMVYATARILTRRSNLLHGITAVGLFFTFKVIADYSGITVVDITAMMIVAMIVLLYVLSNRYDHQVQWIVIAIGCLFFLAFKAKEPSIIAGVILIGLGFSSEGRFDARKLAKNLVLFAIGAAGGVLIFVILNSVLLKEPFFGLAPSYFLTFAGEVPITEGLNPEAEDWYSGYLLSMIPVTFLLYLISGMKQGDDLSPSVRLLWLIPLALIIFLTISMTKGDWGIRGRHLFLVLPLFALLGPQFMIYNFPDDMKGRVKLGISMSAGMGVVFLVIWLSKLFMARIGGDVTIFIIHILYPIVLSILLGAIILFREYSTKTVALPIVCISLLAIGPLQSNIKSIAITRENEAYFNYRVYPFVQFEDDIHYTPAMRLYLSNAIPEEIRMLSNNRDQLLSLFNLYFRASSERDNFTIGSVIQEILDDLFDGYYDYVLLTAGDWEIINQEPGDWAKIDTIYGVRSSGDPELFFLSKLERSSY